MSTRGHQHREYLTLLVPVVFLVLPVTVLFALFPKTGYSCPGGGKANRPPNHPQLLQRRRHPARWPLGRVDQV
jgi:hypothetical protein